MEAVSPGTSAAGVVDSELELASQPFVGRWNQLISTTNWEKGKIICEWREALIASSAPVTEYSDEAWGRRVGAVTGQHVGRLRRVYQRFGAAHEKYPKLFWSHFQAALDWDDAEMWLEGAIHSGWSVSEMRRTRWETLGGDAALQPRDGEIVAAEVDEDYSADEDDDSSGVSLSAGPVAEGPDFGDEDSESDSDNDGDEYPEADSLAREASAEPAALVRPFENLPELPPDLSDAFDAFKLAILRHKTSDWRDVSCEAVLASLDALKTLAVAPSAGDSVA